MKNVEFNMNMNFIIFLCFVGYFNAIFAIIIESSKFFFFFSNYIDQSPDLQHNYLLFYFWKTKLQLHVHNSTNRFRYISINLASDPKPKHINASD